MVNSSIIGKITTITNINKYIAKITTKYQTKVVLLTILSITSTHYSILLNIWPFFNFLT